MKRTRLLALLSLLGVLLIAFVALKESREPHLWLFVDDVLHPKPAPHTIPLSGGLAVRLYADTRPHVGKVARLQKGLILLDGDREVVEEGFGLGLPLVKVAGRAYLSRSATTEYHSGPARTTLVKRYEMDTLDTPSGFLRRKYEPVPSIGTVTVSYTLAVEAIEVTVDLAGLETSWDQVYVMNEQGARTFTRYEEAGLAVEGAAFGRWQPTTSHRGCIVAGDRSLQFCVETEKEVPRYYGRERYYQYYPLGVYALSWAGIDLELAQPARRLTYRIEVERPDGE
jgi:hypothetical protein